MQNHCIIRLDKGVPELQGGYEDGLDDKPDLTLGEAAAAGATASPDWACQAQALKHGNGKSAGKRRPPDADTRTTI